MQHTTIKLHIRDNTRSRYGVTRLTMRFILLLSLTLIPAMLAAQEGRIAFRRSVQFDFEVPEELEKRLEERGMGDQIPSQRSSELILLFNQSESVMISAPRPEQEAPMRVARLRGLGTRLRMGSSSRSDQETLLHSYVSFEDGTMAETREFMGRHFLISGTRPTYKWKLTGEQREFLGHVVQKATAEHDGSPIEAWFTMEIPVQAGPGPFGGLPGMILMASIDEGHTVYTATDIDLTKLGEEAIQPPEGGSEVTREDYERIVAEKLEEARKLRAGRVRRPPF